MRFELFSEWRWLERRIRREALRLSAEGQGAVSATDLGRLTELELRNVLAALRALPHGASAAATAAALAPLRDAVPSDPEACWFCGTRAEAPRMIQGGLARICEECVNSAVAAVSAPPATSGAPESVRCGFCGKWAGPDAWLAGGEVRLFRGRHAAICSECVALGAEVFAEIEGRSGPDRPTSSDTPTDRVR